MLNKLKLSKNEDGSFNVLSKINGNFVTIHPPAHNYGTDIVLWTILNDLYEEGHITDSGQ